MFRDKSPYTFPGGVSKIVLHNAARVAEVWMDEWGDFYYAMNPGLIFFARSKQIIIIYIKRKIDAIILSCCLLSK